MVATTHTLGTHTLGTHISTCLSGSLDHATRTRGVYNEGSSLVCGTHCHLPCVMSLMYVSCAQHFIRVA